MGLKNGTKGHNSLAINKSLTALPDSHQYLIALSGGLDSMVLLHAMGRIRDQLTGELKAIHVHHGMADESNDWLEHCRTQCTQLNIPLEARFVKVNTQGEGIEAEARKQRYAVLAEALEHGGVLLTAHHKNDQAETVIHHLIRGSGPAGLAAMPAVKAFANGQHCRPLLKIDREPLVKYANQNNIDYVEDPSNKDTSYSRNYIRHNILPEMVKHWPAAINGISRAATIQSEQLQLADEIAKEDLAQITHNDGSLITTKLELFGNARQRNCLRYWLRHFGHQDINLQQAQLDKLLQEVIHASADSTPVMRIGNTEIKRYHGHLFQLPKQQINEQGGKGTSTVTWNLDTDLTIPSLGLYLQPQILHNIAGLKPAETVEVRFRRGGEKFQLPGQKNHKTLKQLFQQWQVPTWRRNNIPLIYYKNELVIIWGYAVREH